jgi:hypothetical protein
VFAPFLHPVQVCPLGLSDSKVVTLPQGHGGYVKEKIQEKCVSKNFICSFATFNKI